jgi:general secretion pathway protein G
MQNQTEKGFTLIELIVTVTIVAVLASAAMPMLKVTLQRNKESELRANLRQIREAIDAYKKASDEGRIKKNIEESGYPPNLEILVEGAIDEKDVNKGKIKFLRTIPLDPMQPVDEPNADIPNNWGLRSYESEATAPQAGSDVFDVYSKSQQTGINGVPYAKW